MIIVTKSISVFLLIFLIPSAFAQIHYKGSAVFDNGDTINFNYQDDATVLPKYQINISPFAPSTEDIGFRVQGVYRKSPNLFVRTSAFGGYQTSFSKLSKKLLDIRSVVEYAVFARTKKVERNITLKNQGNTFWVTEKLQHEKRRFMGLDLGLAYTDIGEGIVHDGYSGEASKFLGVTSGISFQSTGSARRDSDIGKKKISSSYLTSRVYFNFSYGAVNFSSVTQLSPTAPSAQIIPKRASWRFGWEGEWGLGHTPFSFITGFEMGTAPYYIIRINQEDKSYQGGFLMVHVGIGIGENPWKNKAP